VLSLSVADFLVGFFVMVPAALKYQATCMSYISPLVDLLYFSVKNTVRFWKARQHVVLIESYLMITIIINVRSHGLLKISCHLSRLSPELVFVLGRQDGVCPNKLDLFFFPQ
jgi:hypothetical protein